MSAGLEQLVVGALLNDLAILHHQDDVGVADRGEPVGNDEAVASTLFDTRRGREAGDLLIDRNETEAAIREFQIALAARHRTSPKPSTI